LTEKSTRSIWETSEGDLSGPVIRTSYTTSSGSGGDMEWSLQAWSTDHWARASEVKNTRMAASSTRSIGARWPARTERGVPNVPGNAQLPLAQQKAQGVPATVWGGWGPIEKLDAILDCAAVVRCSRLYASLICTTANHATVAPPAPVAPSLLAVPTIACNQRATSAPLSWHSRVTCDRDKYFGGLGDSDVGLRACFEEIASMWTRLVGIARMMKR
jgi:hypothetical protein